MCTFSKKVASSSSSTPSRQLQQSQSCTITQAEPAAVDSKQYIRRRRKLKSALFFALATSAIAFCPTTTHAFSTANRSGLSQRKHEWIARSVEYYSTVMRKNAATAVTSSKPSPKLNCKIDSTASIAEVPLLTNNKEDNDNIVAYHHDKDFVGLATKHYYARFLIKTGKWDFAEKIYRRIIDELADENDENDGQCDHTKLAVSTLLLALHLQRTGDVKATRAVFISFFRRVASSEEVHKCSCSAKVLQAYALFEMKNGHSAKSLEIIQRAVKMDEQLSPVLGWKQFRDAAAGREYVPTVSFRKIQKAKNDVAP
mmetsp:Transcript_24577/g.42066  ORF Transcript_24577/g.42066 Transcript_24577/m.42066 type:complete len:313 (+) Transcript_24577:250-1188(+)